MSNNNLSTIEAKKIIIISKPASIKNQIDKGNLFTFKKGEYKIELKINNNNNHISKKEIDNTINALIHKDLSKISEKSSDNKNINNNSKKRIINSILNNNETVSDYGNNNDFINDNEIIFPKNIKLNTEPALPNGRKYLNSNDNFLSNVKENIKNSERSSLKVMVEEKTSKENENENEKFDTIFSINKNNFGNSVKQNIINETNEYIVISPKNDKKYKKCFICEYLFLPENLLFPECHRHCLCKKCAKNFYEDAIEDGKKILKCPSTKCQSKMNIKKLEKIISEQHYSLVDDNSNSLCGSIYNAKLKTNIKTENLKLYTQKHVLDINSNQTFFNFNKKKGLFCPKCEQESLYSKTNTVFLKCLNCNQKVCKYCLKYYHDNHLDINSEDHCKVYFRKNRRYDNKLNTCVVFYIQLFFVIAIYYLTFVGILLSLLIGFKKIFCVKGENNKNQIGRRLKIFFVLFFSILGFLISIPFIIVILPYFPVIITLSDI